MFSNSPLDWALVVAYFAMLAVIWLRRFGARPSTEDYFVAGRAVTLPAFVATLVSTWYGGILGVGEYSWRYGLANWLVFGVPYYLGALLFALFFAKRARDTKHYTLPDLLHAHYGRGAALVGAGAVFLTSAPAAYVLMLGTLFAAMSGFALVPCVLAAAALSVFYVDRGGLRTVVFTDQIQFALMYGGFAVLLAFLFARHGGLEFLVPRVPHSHFVWHGGNPPAAIFVWYFIALGTLVDPGFFQRAYAAKDARTARAGVLWSIAFWILFDFMTTASGLYARALLPNLKDPVFAFPELARLTLPPVALGLFYLGMIATVMSTIDSYAFIAATTVSRDFVWRLRGGDESALPALSRAGLWVATAFATVLALSNQSVIGLWHDLGSITTPTLLLPVALALAGRGRPGTRGALVLMLVPSLLSSWWVVYAHAFATPRGGYPWSIEPVYAGLGSSLLVWLSLRAFGALERREIRA
ncbi:MAG: sodium:solute symporter family protein [Candidatus Eisenbacteria bacterium]|uniref:Sodium:solute symporter family protein n=1 Tax=Eiseniibacteriota bacterium TaxID=2212470 RepID=A0A933W7T5_UNCEI|nr:sodium:solute symporter family protein [Candidatus Eisenbacteria bacterium]